MVEKLDKYVGTTGSTSDESFKKITDILNEVGTVIHENENTGYLSELVYTQYVVENKDNGKKKMYGLWYQTRTPFSPKHMECSFGFTVEDRLPLYS